MDSLTHALAAAIIAYSIGFPQFIPFAVIGAVIIDTDIIFSLISDSHPSLYLFVHGGIAHSLTGAVVMSALAYTGITLAALVGLINPALLVRAGPAGFAAVLFGAFLHIAMDLPATPGIPLFAPKSDKKYALFILPGPSLFMLTVSLFFLIWLALGVVTLAEGMATYAAILVAFLLVPVRRVPCITAGTSRHHAGDPAGKPAAVACDQRQRVCLDGKGLPDRPWDD